MYYFRGGEEKLTIGEKQNFDHELQRTSIFVAIGLDENSSFSL